MTNRDCCGFPNTLGQYGYSKVGSKRDSYVTFWYNQGFTPILFFLAVTLKQCDRERKRRQKERRAARWAKHMQDPWMELRGWGKV